MRWICGPLLVVCWMASAAFSQTTRHVWSNSPSPEAPFLSWSTAARTLQDAVDAARAGDIVLATNGVYFAGGRPAPGREITNRLLVEQPILIRSVNGPDATVIRGQGPLGKAAVRCAYLTNGATLSGFRLENGHADDAMDPADGQDCDGGGVLAFPGCVVTRCHVVSNQASRRGGGADLRGGIVQDCVFIGNQGHVGGGLMLSDGSAIRIAAVSNRAVFGGGLAGSSRDSGTNQIVDVALRFNTADQEGGGLFLLPSARVDIASTGTNACDIRGNAATHFGGGLCAGTQAVLAAKGQILFAFNRAGIGGGLAAVEGSQATFEADRSCRSEFIGNTAAESGGGIALLDGAALLGTDLEFTFNQCLSGCGGALFLRHSQASLSSTRPDRPAVSDPRTRFLDNQAPAGEGGAICSRASQLAIQSAAFFGNYAASGGAIRLDGGTGRLDNAVLAGNFAAESGGGLLADGAEGSAARCHLRHCTLFGNSPGGVLADGPIELSLVDCIVHGNDGVNVSPGRAVSFSDIEGGYEGPGNIDADPFFRDTDTFDLRLTLASAGGAADTGTDAGLASDCVFRARPLGAGFDMGAFEFNLDRDDSDGDGIPDAWELDHGLDPLNAADGPAHADSDFIPNLDEYLADTDPQDSDDFFRLDGIGYSLGRGASLGFASSSNRLYTLHSTEISSNGSVWISVPGQILRPGAGTPHDELDDTNAAARPARAYRVTAVPIPE